MAVYEKLNSDQEDGSPTKLSAHRFAEVLKLWLMDVINTTQAQAGLPELNSDDGDYTELTAIETTYDGLEFDTQRLFYLERVHSVAILSEKGTITKAQAQAILGF